MKYYLVVVAIYVDWLKQLGGVCTANAYKSTEFYFLMHNLYLNLHINTFCSKLIKVYYLLNKLTQQKSRMNNILMQIYYYYKDSATSREWHTWEMTKGNQWSHFYDRCGTITTFCFFPKGLCITLCNHTLAMQYVRESNS